MIDVVLSEYDTRVIEIYLSLYNTATLTCNGRSWFVHTTEQTMEFKGYKGFIDYIIDEVKQDLLNYAINKDLKEIVGI